MFSKFKGRSIQPKFLVQNQINGQPDALFPGNL